MRFFVQIEAFDSIVGDAEVTRLRGVVAAQMQAMALSGKLESGGVFVGKRGGYAVLNVESAEELMDLLGSRIIDNCTVVTHPLVDFEHLGEFFAKHPVGG